MNKQRALSVIQRLPPGCTSVLFDHAPRPGELARWLADMHPSITVTPTEDPFEFLITGLQSLTIDGKRKGDDREVVPSVDPMAMNQLAKLTPFLPDEWQVGPSVPTVSIPPPGSDVNVKFVLTAELKSQFDGDQFRWYNLRVFTSPVIDRQTGVLVDPMSEEREQYLSMGPLLSKVTPLVFNHLIINDVIYYSNAGQSPDDPRFSITPAPPAGSVTLSSLYKNAQRSLSNRSVLGLDGWARNFRQHCQTLFDLWRENQVERPKEWSEWFRTFKAHKVTHRSELKSIEEAFYYMADNVNLKGAKVLTEAFIREAKTDVPSRLGALCAKNDLVQWESAYLDMTTRDERLVVPRMEQMAQQQVIAYDQQAIDWILYHKANQMITWPLFYHLSQRPLIDPRGIGITTSICFADKSGEPRPLFLYPDKGINEAFLSIWLFLVVNAMDKQYTAYDLEVEKYINSFDATDVNWITKSTFFDNLRGAYESLFSKSLEVIEKYVQQRFDRIK